LVLYEAPHRIHETLDDIASVLGDRMVAVGRELTKAHEELGVRPISAWLEVPPTAKGEFTLAIEGASAVGEAGNPATVTASLCSDFGELTNFGAVGRRQAVKELAQRYGLSTNDVYRRLEKLKK
jgi:16S rRNA (cytidine1402-2'-O)-methyltransferase